jgi:hypothetical protein
MKVAAVLLRQWHSDNPARLLQAALWQAERLAEMAPELEALRAENISPFKDSQRDGWTPLFYTHRDQTAGYASPVWGAASLEVKTKRIAQLEEALEAAERAAHRQAAPFRIEQKKRLLAPKRPGLKRAHPGDALALGEGLDFGDKFSSDLP